MDVLLEKLEGQIKNLLAKHSQLLQERDSLAQMHKNLAQEKKTLHEKHQGAISQIEKMIDRLKLLETA